MEDKVEVIEIWRPVESGGEAVSMREGRSQSMKLSAYIVNGYPVRLEDGFMLERSFITEAEEKQILSNAQAGTPAQNITIKE